MKLRLDLLDHLTAEDILEEALANVHRYNPEPLLAKTGVGSLTPATPEEREKELERCVALTPETGRMRLQKSRRWHTSDGLKLVIGDSPPAATVPGARNR